MYTPEALLDVHARTHRSLRGLIAHGATGGDEVVGRALPGFAYPTVRVQLLHVLYAELYWFGVLRGEMVGGDEETSEEPYARLEPLRVEIAGKSVAYLRGTTAAELNTPRRVVTWGGKEPVLVPAHVVLRVCTHVFDHKGQLADMFRALGRPVPAGLDFPLDGTSTRPG